jgi:sulfite reductase (NADPH) hemoprotein beta-component
MSVVDDPKTFGRARLSFASVADIDEFVTTLERYERGEMTPDQWRAFRLVRGTYGQRQAEDAQMLRVKIPQGVLTSDQLDALAEVGERYSRGFGHITTTGRTCSSISSSCTTSSTRCIAWPTRG